MLGPIAAAMKDVVFKLQQINTVLDPWYADTDLAKVFSSILISKKDQKLFAFTWNYITDAITPLPWGQLTLLPFVKKHITLVHYIHDMTWIWWLGRVYLLEIF